MGTHSLLKAESVSIPETDEQEYKHTQAPNVIAFWRSGYAKTLVNRGEALATESDGETATFLGGFVHLEEMPAAPGISGD